MNRTVATLIFAVLLSVAILWAGGVGLVSYRNWHDTHRRIELKRDAEKQSCAERYYDHDAKQRCEHLHDVKYVTEINVAKATRALIAGGPLILILIVGVMILRGSAAKEKERQRRARSTGRRRTNRSPA